MRSSLWKLGFSIRTPGFRFVLSFELFLKERPAFSGNQGRAIGKGLCVLLRSFWQPEISSKSCHSSWPPACDSLWMQIAKIHVTHLGASETG